MYKKNLLISKIIFYIAVFNFSVSEVVVSGNVFDFLFDPMDEGTEHISRIFQCFPNDDEDYAAINDARPNDLVNNSGIGEGEIRGNRSEVHRHDVITFRGKRISRSEAAMKKQSRSVSRPIAYILFWPLSIATLPLRLLQGEFSIRPEFHPSEEICPYSVRSSTLTRDEIFEVERKIKVMSKATKVKYNGVKMPKDTALKLFKSDTKSSRDERGNPVYSKEEPLTLENQPAIKKYKDKSMYKSMLSRHKGAKKREEETALIEAIHREEEERRQAEKEERKNLPFNNNAGYGSGSSSNADAEENKRRADRAEEQRRAGSIWAQEQAQKKREADFQEKQNRERENLRREQQRQQDYYRNKK